MLMCTTTDMAVVCGGNGEVCYSKYGSYPLKAKYCQFATKWLAGPPCMHRESCKSGQDLQTKGETFSSEGTHRNNELTKAFEYKKLLLDYNREVRKATHETMANLVTTVGKDLAPHLKSLMGPWWFAQFDAVHEVSQAARRSFQVAFTVQEKRLDALMLCTDEVSIYLEENLKLTPQSMSDKAVALDELQEMHQQVISSSLLSLATLLDILTNEKHSREVKHSQKAKSSSISHVEKLFSLHKCFFRLP